MRPRIYISDYPHRLRTLAEQALQNAAEHPSPGAKQTWAAVAAAINEAADKVAAIVDGRA